MSPDSPLIADGDGPAVEFIDVSLTYETNGVETQAVGSVSFDVDYGQFVSVVGPSGCGKSTLLNVAAGLFRPTSGTARVCGVVPDKPSTRVGYVTQQDNLLPWRTAAGNISLGLEVQGVPRKERQLRVESMLELVGLQGFGKHYPSQLSGGMRKRVTLARTLIYSPEVVLLDEPFSALDAQLRETLHAELLSIWQRLGCTIIFVTHDIDEAISLSDRVIVLSGRPSRVVRDQPVDIARPRALDEVRLSPEFSTIYRGIRKLVHSHG